MGGSQSVKRWGWSRDDIPSTTAMDTETFRGTLKVICTPDASFEPVGPPGSDMRALSTLDWIWTHGAEIVWMWNLAFDRDVICRPIAETEGFDAEAKAEFLTQHKFHIADYTIKLIGAKSFSIQRKGSHRKIDFFDAGTFYRDSEAAVPLDTAAKEVLGHGKNAEELGIDRAKIGDEPGYFESHRDRIVPYCRRDAQITKELGDRLFEVSKAAIGFYPRRWSSAASLSKAWLERKCPSLVRHKKRTASLNDPFHLSYRGGIFMSKLGRVEGIDEVDIVNAYGSALMRVPRLDDLTEPIRTDRYSPGAVLGSYQIFIEYDGHLPARTADAYGDVEHPEKDRPERIVYPTSRGALRPYMADRVEMEHFAATGRRFVVVTAHEMFPRDPSRPIRLQFPEIGTILERVAALKKQAKAGHVAAKLEREFLKKVVNATYGSMAEAKHGITPFTTWAIASFITAWCRRLIWQQWDAIEATGGEVVSVNTDSLRVRCPKGHYEVPLTHSGEIGRFEAKFRNCTVVHYQSGIALILHRAGHDPECHECATLPRMCWRGGQWVDHPAGCACCQRDGFAVHLRRRGMPRLTAATLANAVGTEFRVDGRRGLHISEGIIQGRMDEVADIRGPRDEDDGLRRRPVRLDANLMVFDVDPAQLTFQTLFHEEIPCLPLYYDEVVAGGWIDSRIEMRREHFGMMGGVELEAMRRTVRWSQTVTPAIAVHDLHATDLGDSGIPFTPGQIVPPRGPRPMRRMDDIVYPPPINGTNECRPERTFRLR